MRYKNVIQKERRKRYYIQIVPVIPYGRQTKYIEQNQRYKNESPSFDDKKRRHQNHCIEQSLNNMSRYRRKRIRVFHYFKIEKPYTGKCRYKDQRKKNECIKVFRKKSNDRTPYIQTFTNH